MCAENEPITTTTPVKKPISNNKQQLSNQIDIRGSSENLHNLSKKNSIKNTAAAVADKNRKNEANSSGPIDSFTSTKSGKFCLLRIKTLIKLEIRRIKISRMYQKLLTFCLIFY